MKRIMKTVLSVCTIDIYSQYIKEEKNGYASLNVNGVVRSVQANMETGIRSSAVTVLTPSDLYVVSFKIWLLF
jgi:hypothetical protein